MRGACDEWRLAEDGLLTYNELMNRILALLLILLLPFQTTLAAVMAIEMSAPSASTQMLAGEDCHHQMTTSSDLTAIGAEVSADGNANPHGNCGICHFSCCSTLPISTPIVAAFSVSETFSFAALVQPPAPPAARPERPNWASLA